MVIHILTYLHDQHYLRKQVVLHAVAFNGFVLNSFKIFAVGLITLSYCFIYLPNKLSKAR